MSNNPYTGHGYANRQDYLDSLADQAGEDGDMVHALADLLGPTEDFDGLITALTDYGIQVSP